MCLSRSTSGSLPHARMRVEVDQPPPSNTVALVVDTGGRSAGGIKPLHGLLATGAHVVSPVTSNPPGHVIYGMLLP